jgi:hypothetical protein
MTRARNFRELTNERARFTDDTSQVSRVRRMIRALRRAQADATYLNERMLEWPK